MKKSSIAVLFLCTVILGAYLGIAVGRANDARLEKQVRPIIELMEGGPDLEADGHTLADTLHNRALTGKKVSVER